MTSDWLTRSPVLAAGIVALLTNLFLAGLLYGASETSSRHLAQVIAWWRRTFTDDDRKAFPARPHVLDYSQHAKTARITR